MSDDIRVLLAWSEILIAAQVGIMRNVQALKEEWDKTKGDPRENWTNNIEGACGEQATAKHFGMYWDGRLGDPSADDVGPYQVRTNASRRLDDMILRPWDKDDKPYISVLSFTPWFIICGWLMCRDGKKEKWLRVGTPGRPPCYFVPRSELHPLSTLPWIE